MEIIKTESKSEPNVIKFKKISSNAEHSQKYIYCKFKLITK